MNRRRVGLRGGAILLAACVAAGCGSDAGQFDAQVDRARAAIEAGDRAAAVEAFDALEMEALLARDRGVIGEDELNEVADRLQSSRALLDQVLPPPTTTTTTTTSEPPDDDDDDGDDDDDDDKGGKNGKGRGKGNDKD